MRASLAAAFFVAGLLVGIGLSGKAADYLVVSGLAIHLDGARHCNSITTGLGIERSTSENDRSQFRYALGFYRNSNCRTSAYAAFSWLPLRFGDWRGGTITGLVTGYRTSPLPAGGLVLAYEPPHSLGFNVIFIPPAGDTSSGVLWIQAKRAF